MRLKHTQLYLREYPLLLQAIERLVELAQKNSNVILFALFGSTARLEPRATSDADVLALLHDPDLLDPEGRWPQIISLMVNAQEAPLDEWCDWPFSVIDGDAQASDLDEDFLANVAQDGVLLYQQEGTHPPPALTGLLPFPVWRERVERLLADCTRKVAAATARASACAQEHSYPCPSALEA